MDISYDAVIAALREPHNRAMQARGQRKWREGDLIDETLLDAILPLIVSSGEEIAWVRALRQICDQAVPLIIDGLATEEFSRVQLRISAAVLVPKIETLAALDDIGSTISDAIAIGAPAYNNGEPLTCGLLYFAIALTLVQAPATRGIAGQARALKPLRAVLDEQPAQSLKHLGAANDYAWQMRRALDASLALMA